MRSEFICTVKPVEWTRMKQRTPATPDESDPQRMSVVSVCWMWREEKAGRNGACSWGLWAQRSMSTSRHWNALPHPGLSRPKYTGFPGIRGCRRWVRRCNFPRPELQTLPGSKVLKVLAATDRQIMAMVVAMGNLRG